MMYDVIIVGGSFAGLAAAMQLVRAQRKVLVIDSNLPRNRFATASHGIFCLDGKTPAEIRKTALKQLLAYPTFEFWQDAVTAAEKQEDQFMVDTRQDMRAKAKRLILAFGITDKLPELAGLQKYWGKNVVHCPYCHGYELRNTALGVLATSELSMHQAAMIPDWGDTTLFTQGVYFPEPAFEIFLRGRNVNFEHSPVAAVNGNDEKMESVELADGRIISLGGLYVGPKIQITSPLVNQLGLSLSDAPLGKVVEVNELKESSVKGVYVAGDLSNPMQSGTLAIASGTMAGISTHQSLIFEGLGK
ncbi:MAG: thioredoxin reductase [Alteromonadaceae bacterium]|nr:thioredoxin reductase [Alteromonadaceae bacterium]